MILDYFGQFYTYFGRGTGSFGWRHSRLTPRNGSHHTFVVSVSKRSNCCESNQRWMTEEARLDMCNAGNIHEHKQSPTKQKKKCNFQGGDSRDSPLSMGGGVCVKSRAGKLPPLHNLISREISSHRLLVIWPLTVPTESGAGWTLSAGAYGGWRQ